MVEQNAEGLTASLVHRWAASACRLLLRCENKLLFVSATASGSLLFTAKCIFSNITLKPFLHAHFRCMSLSRCWAPLTFIFKTFFIFPSWRLCNRQTLTPISPSPFLSMNLTTLGPQHDWGHAVFCPFGTGLCHWAQCLLAHPHCSRCQDVPPF